MTDLASKPLFKLAFFCAIGSTIGWILFIVVSTGNPSLPPISEPVNRLAALQAGKNSSLIYGWGGVFGALLTIPYLFAMVSAIPSRGGEKWIAFLAGAIGALMTAVSFMGAALAPVYYVLPHILEHPELAPSYLIALEVANAGLEPMWFFGSFLAYGLAVVWIAYDALKAGIGPGWLNWVGIGGGIAGTVWLRPFLSFLLPFETVGSIANIVLLSIWAVGLTLVLWRKGQ
ncbi:MAG: hypothetical protein GY945_03455 [Rhodobacteraceae bacterium]|nr:hypothetical protein [Paracoccaceae bacterium]